MVYHECKTGESGTKNTGYRDQCLVGVTVRYAVGKPTFSFDTVADAKDLDKWNEAIAAKNLIPLYDVNEYAIADTEATFYEGKTSRYETGKAKKIRTFRSVIGSCSYAALSSYNEKEMDVYEFTEDGYIKSVITADKKIKGQRAKINVGRLQDAIDGTPQSAVVTVNYKDFNEYEQNAANLLPEDWGYTDIYGIFDVAIEQVGTASSTSIKFKVVEGCAGGGSNVTSLIAGDIIVKDGSGGVETVSFVPADADGVYEVTGTGFADGYTIELDGVVTSGGSSYESEDVLTVNVTP
jgi:hypothetical protein